MWYVEGLTCKRVVENWGVPPVYSLLSSFQSVVSGIRDLRSRKEFLSSLYSGWAGFVCFCILFAFQLGSDGYTATVCLSLCVIVVDYTQHYVCKACFLKIPLHVCPIFHPGAAAGRRTEPVCAEEPLESLQAALSKLRACMADPSQYDGEHRR